MKKILFALAILASVQVAQAQVKSVADAQKALEAAKAAAENPKKAVKALTWTKLGDSYVSAYDAPAGSLWVNASKQELSLLMKEQPVSVENVVIGGNQYSKEVYENKNLYFTPEGTLSIIEVTKPVEDNALSKAAEAYQKAYSIDPKAKGVSEGLESIAQKYMSEGYTKYQLGKYADGSVLFEDAAETAAMKPLEKVDTNAIYNAGFLAQAAGDNSRAKKFYQQCYDLGYFAKDGDVYSRLATVDADNAKNYLEEGFAKYPNSQSILIGLINYYTQAGEGTERLFELLNAAKVNEPNNASLYYVEGNIHAQLGDYDAAVKAYEQCAQVNPKYEFGYVGEGIMYYNRAIELQEKAQAELDDAKYAALAEEFVTSLKNCIAPFEKAYELSKDNATKVGIAEYLKNANYRFRDEDPKYQAAYDKYNKVVSSGQAE